MIAAATTVAELEIPISERGPSPRKVIVAYGFWLFLLSDIIIFSALFAAYAVLAGLGGVIAAGLTRAWQTEHEFEVTLAEIEGARG